MFYKDFIQSLRDFELNEVHIIVHDLSPHLNKLIQELDIAEHQHIPIHAYYGDIKNVIIAFLVFWEDTMDKSIKIADEITHSTTKSMYLELVEQSVNIQKSKQVDFGKEFLPVISAEDRKAYEDIKNKYDLYIDALDKKKEKLEDIAARFYPNHVKEADFVNEDMKIMLNSTHYLFRFTYDYIAMTLIDHLKEMISSLKEIRNNVNNDMKNQQNESKKCLEKLHLDLFMKKKEQIIFTKQNNKNSMELGANVNCQNVIRGKINTIQQRDEKLIIKFKEELKYWDEKIKDIIYIDESLNTLKAHKQSFEEQEMEYNKILYPYMPEIECDHRISFKKNIRSQKEKTNSDILETARSLVTHYAMKGFSKKIYKDIFGYHYLEQDNHKLYLTQRGQTYEQNAAGTFKKAMENENMFHKDHLGRYYVDDDKKKVYNRNVGASFYQLDEQEDCLKKMATNFVHDGETENIFRETEDIVLPSVENIDIKATLDPESAEYIWESFGSTLPYALADVLKMKPKNPLHYLAHRLLVHKNGRTKKEAELKQNESLKYRADIIEGKSKELLRKHMLLKSKDVKRAKAEDLDDDNLWQSCDAHLSKYELINVVNTDNRGYM